MCINFVIAIETHGPSEGALDAESPKKQKKQGRDIGVFLMDLHHILHARNRLQLLWFPHTPKPPRPLKRLKTSIYFLHFSNFCFFCLRFGGPFGLWLHVPCRGHASIPTRWGMGMATRRD